jgi:hypothetical protein
MEASFQNLNPENFTQLISDPVVSPILAILAFFVVLIFGVIILIGIYIYLALALKAIAKKMGYSKPWLAWIPIANLFLFPILTKRKWTWGLLFFIPVVNIVFLIICLWEMLEKKGHDGKWSLILLGGLFVKPAFPFVAFVAFLVILGILAWKKK